jgi:hypothetical protein
MTKVWWRGRRFGHPSCVGAWITFFVATGRANKWTSILEVVDD